MVASSNLRKPTMALDAAWERAWAASAAAPAAHAWPVATRVYDPRAPAGAEMRRSGALRVCATDAAEVVAALDALPRADLVAWFADAAALALADMCAELLHECVAPAELPCVIDTLYQWVCVRQTLGAELGDGGALLHACKTPLAEALRPRELAALQAYFAGALRIADGAVVLEPHGVQACAQLRALGLDALMQGVLTRTATQMLEDAADEATRGSGRARGAWDRAVHPALHELLCEQLMPALTAMLDARPAHLSLSASAPLLDVWDVSVSAVHEAPPTDHEALYLRLEYSLARALGERRLAQLFDLVGAYPASRAAISDVLAWLEKTDERAAVAASFAHALHTRQLHPGVDTHAILVYYVNIVYALRLVDTSGVVLSRVLPPVQRYLRTRADTIEAVVHALLGDDAAFALLRTELASTSAGAPLRAEDDEPYARPEYWADASWAPRPVDAGPEYSQMRTRDVVGLLVSIFDDHAGFLAALERHTAQQLVRTVHYDTARVERNNAIFKRRLGASSLHHCDVMLRDVATSRALDAAWHAACAAARATDTLAAAVHPLVISRQFWPELDAPTFTLPRRFADALDAFARVYEAQHPRKKVRWLPHLGTVDLDIELDSGRTVHVAATPLQAAVAECVAGLGTVTADNVAAALAVERHVAVGALRFWAAHDVVRELPAPSGVFEVCS